MADTIRELIMQNIETTLKGTQFKGKDLQIQRIPVSIPQLVNFPSVQIVEGDESKVIQVKGLTKYQCNLTVEIQLALSSNDPVLPSEVNNFFGSVEAALMQNTTRGTHPTTNRKLALDTTSVRNGKFLSNADRPFGGILVEILVVYRHLFADPFSN